VTVSEPAAFVGLSRRDRRDMATRRRAALASSASLVRGSMCAAKSKRPIHLLASKHCTRVALGSCSFVGPKTTTAPNAPFDQLNAKLPARDVVDWEAEVGLSRAGQTSWSNRQRPSAQAARKVT
jgi:hypothetical protein